MENEVNESFVENESKEYPKTSDWSDLAKKMDDDKPKKSKKGLKILFAILILILIILASLLAYLKFIKPDSKKVYMSILKEFSEEISEQLEEKEKSSGNISIYTNMKNLKSFDNTSLNYSVIIKENSTLSELAYNEEGKNLLNGTIFQTKGKYYIYSKDLYKKPLMISSDSKNMSIKTDNKSNKYLINKTEKYLINSLSKAKYITKYEILEIDSGKVPVQKNILKVDKQTGNEIKNKFLTRLKADDKYLETLSNISGLNKEKIKEEIDIYLKENINKDLEMEIDTNFFTNDLVKISIKSDKKEVLNIEQTKDVTYTVTLYDEDKKTEGLLTIRDDELIFEIEQKDYKYNLTLKEDKDIINIRIKVTDKNSKYFTIDIKNTEKDVNIKEINIKKAVDIYKMNDSESAEFSSNIEKLIKRSKILSELM